MALEKNIQPETTFGISQIEKDTELVQQAVVDNEIPSSLMLTGAGHSEAAECSTKPKAVDQVDKRKKERGEGKKRKSKKSAVKSKDESLVKHVDNIVGDISSTVSARVFDEKSIDERKNDKDAVFSAERNEVSEKTVEDVGRASLRIDESIVKHTSDAATLTNEEYLLPHVERKESVEMACIDDLPVDHGRNDDIMMNNDVEVSRTENNKSQVNAKGVNDNSEKANEKMDGGTKKNKTKKSAKISAGRSDDVAVVANEDKLLPQTEGNENTEMTSVDPLHIHHVRNDNILMNNDVELSRTERNMTQVNDGGINDELHKQNEKMA